MTSQTLHLFAIPYAGSSAVAAYGRWPRLLPPSVEIEPLELAGRGRRTPEAFHVDLHAAVADLLKTVEPTARRQRPYALYGHSMGAMLAYELVKAIAGAGLPPPRKLFLSGCNSPHSTGRRRDLHRLQDDLFLAEIRKLGGTPDEFFEMRELVAAFLPVLRSDYRMIEQYEAELPAHVTPADIVFFSSDADPLISERGVEDWRSYTSGSFDRQDFSGGHFFINDNSAEVCRLLGKGLVTG